VICGVTSMISKTNIMLHLLTTISVGDIVLIMNHDREMMSKNKSLAFLVEEGYVTRVVKQLTEDHYNVGFSLSDSGREFMETLSTLDQL